MIYSKKLGTHIPITIECQKSALGSLGTFTKYFVKDNKITIGHVNLIDTITGVNVDYIENYHPDKYSGFGKIADQLEVEHCLKRGLTYFDIISDGALNSHALHYLRGKRFYSDYVNEKVERVIKATPPGEKYNTKFLGKQRMFMPQEVIEKYIEIIKKCPLLK